MKYVEFTIRMRTPYVAGAGRRFWMLVRKVILDMIPDSIVVQGFRVELEVDRS